MKIKIYSFKGQIYAHSPNAKDSIFYFMFDYKKQHYMKLGKYKGDLVKIIGMDGVDMP